MTRTASEILRELEIRIARLEKRAGNFKFNTFYQGMIGGVVYFYPLKKLKNGKIQGVQIDWRGKPRLMSHLDSDFSLLSMREADLDEIPTKDVEKVLAKAHGVRVASSKTANQVASTIVRQLGGGGRLVSMIGLRQMINQDNGVTLVFPLFKHKGAVNRVRITLNGKDLYDMEFIRVRGKSVKTVRTFNDVWGMDLIEKFEEGTGLLLKISSK
tara:strand:- start:2620 stop:3258 length:639 start_codon:yes stop_codon:yes gene_type:complete